MDSSICQTSTASPAEPGGLPWLARRLLMKCFRVVALLAATAACGFAQAQTRTVRSDVLAQSTQAIVVTTPDWNTAPGQLQRFERASVHARWHPVGAPIAVVVGRNGLGWGVGVVAGDGAKARASSGPVKKEGDIRSPAGIFALGTAFGYAAQPLDGLKLPYLQLTPTVECVDDPASTHYNRIVDRAQVMPDWKSSEHMRDAGEAYVWGIVVDHNGTVPGGASQPVPGSGSCVFLHIWAGNGRGTTGCTAMAEPNLETLMIWLDPVRHPLLVQLPEPVYAHLQRAYRLPRYDSVPATTSAK
jgi:L,D-peptidoglycan transpeptidase YkuD (ErfK/YbiS/YcfS/YnhG family)